MKLAVLIADGLPAPAEVHFNDHSVWLDLDTRDDLAAWAAKTGAEAEADLLNSAQDALIVRAQSYDWHGWYLALRSYASLSVESEPPTEDLTQVRKLAAS